MAVGYGHWSKTLVIDGTVTTGSIDVVFTEPAYSPPAITGWSDDPPAPPESLDPSSDWDLVEVSPGVWEWVMVTGSWQRIGSDIAFTDVLLEPDGKTLTVTLADAWACYNPTVYYDMTNNGTVPVAISSIVVTVPDKVPFDCNGDGTIDPGEEARPVTAELSGVAVGSVIDGGSSLPGDLHIHVTDAAAFEATYVITVTFEVVNWNEVGP
jgi:hypothetical protein